MSATEICFLGTYVTSRSQLCNCINTLCNLGGAVDSLFKDRDNRLMVRLDLDLTTVKILLKPFASKEDSEHLLFYFCILNFTRYEGL